VDWLIRVEQVCRQPLPDRILRERLVALVGERIPFDAHLFALTDPVTLVAVSPHANVPMLPWSRLPELIRWRYRATDNRMDRLATGPAVSSVSGIQRELGVTDTASVGFADRYGGWGYLDLWRTTGTFTSAELDLLTSTQPAVTAGLRAALARTFVDEAEQLLPVGPAVVVLGADLVVRTQTEGAAAALLQLLPPGAPMAPIPAAAYNVGAALLAAEAGTPLGESWGRVHLGGSRWVTVKASRLAEDIAVSIEPSASAERADLFGRAHGLSSRESEVLTLVTGGLDSKSIAERLVLSEHTVNDHVKSMLAKTGSPTRQILVSRALGAAG
jgi:DNA-binding CsgD family transcriptional regulator